MKNPPRLLTLAALGWASLLLSTGLHAQPRLEVATTAGGSLQLRWTHQAPGLVLESTDTLASRNAWAAVAEAPIAAGDLRTVTLRPAGAARFYRLREAGMTRVRETSPANGESAVSVTRETIVRFTAPLAAGAQLDPSRFYAEFGGRRLLSRIELSADRRQATLLALEPMPGASRIQVKLATDGLLDGQGQPVDGDGDGNAGGVLEVAFTTMGTVAVPGTGVFGRVFASERAPGAAGTTNRPLAGVTITVDGAEERIRAVTDEEGFFRLQPCPSGRFFVHIDGRTAFDSEWPDGNYYPVVGKTFEAVAGSTNNPAGGTGLVFLPQVKAGTLQSVSASQPTTIGFPPAVLAGHPELEGVSLTVPPNALYADDGTRGGRVGIAPVAPDRIPSPLPPGLNPALVITIQTDGPSNFDQPVPVRFPNLPDPVTGVALPPGAKSALWSYNHDTGRWESQGSMTVSADGKFLESDPGVGVRQPGWHGGSPGSPGTGPGGGPGPCEAEQQALEDALFGCAFGIGLGLLELAPAIGCGVSIASAAAGAINGCSDPNGNCGGSLAYNAFFGIAGCIPGPAGTFAGLMQCGIELGDATANLALCQGQNPSAAALHARALAATDSDPLQAQLNTASSSLISSILGDAQWMEVAQTDPAGTAAFATALIAALEPASDGGTSLTPAERSSILALPAPAGASAPLLQTLLDRFDRFAKAGMTAAESSAITTAASALHTHSTTAQNLGWTTLFDGTLVALNEVSEDFDNLVEGGTGGAGPGAQQARLAQQNAPNPIGPRHEGVLFYRLVDQLDGTLRYGRTEPSGTIPQLITAIDRPYMLTYFDPATLDLGSVFFRSGAAGTPYRIPYARLVPVTGPDSDGDGLPDPAEMVVGTDPHQADTDGDGATDFEEARSGQNPLDGIAMSQGVVGTVLLGGSRVGAAAYGVHAEGSRLFVANYRRGLSIVDISDPLQPAWLSELVLPGFCEDVTYDPASGVVVVSGSPENAPPGDRGLVHFVDASNPAAPRLLESYSVPVAAVDAWDGRIFVALGDFSSKEVHIHDPRSTLRLGLFTTQDYPTGIRVVGGRAYVATLSGLEIWDVTAPVPARLGRLAGDFTVELLGRAHLVLEGTTLYVGKTRGAASIDVSNPAAPVFVGQSPATAGAVRSLALSGGGRLVTLSMGTPAGNLTAASTLSTFLLNNPTNLSTFEAGFAPQWRGRDLVMSGGLALVADDTAGITVMNFANPDLARQAPAITFDPSRLDRDGSAPGIQVLEGETLELAPVVRDDVHLQGVELWIGGQSVASTATYPAVFRVAVPAGRQFNTNLVVQFRATDRSGNAAISTPLSLEVRRDTHPPALAVSVPANRGVAFAGRPFVLQYDEPVDGAPLDASKVRLLALGADAAPGGGDDTEVPLASASALGRLVHLVASQAPAGRFQLTIGAGFARDRAGNATTEAVTLVFDQHAAHPGTAVWVSDADGLWSDPANWLNRHLPVQDDDVLVHRFGATPVVTVNGGAIVKSLTVRTPLKTANRANLQVLRNLLATHPVEIPEDDLGVTGSATFEGPLTLNGGRLSLEGRTEVRGSLTLSRAGSLILDGPAASLFAPGGVAGANFSVLARGGAIVDLPGLETLDAPGDFTSLFPAGTSLVAQGPGSKLTLSGLLQGIGPLNWNARGAPALRFQATSGGELHLPLLTTLTNRVELSASGAGSLLSAPRLASVVGTPDPFPAAITASSDGRVELPSLRTRENCPLTENTGGSVVLPQP